MLSIKMTQLTLVPEVTERAFKENIQHIISNPIQAIVEIVSNSWDAGAEEVLITWPEKPNELAIIEDNGEGMSKTEFENIWPKMSYSRIDSRGKYVEFRRNREGEREVYGKHGKGRHAPFCFANKYTIKTWKNWIPSDFEIVRNKEDGFNVISEEDEDAIQNASNEIEIDKESWDSGTQVSFKIIDNYRSPQEIIEEIGSRFLTDPSFIIKVNGKQIELDDLGEKVKTIDCSIDGKNIEITQIKSDESSRNNNFHGVTWIIGKRRIKNTLWSNLLDGRTNEARHYAFVVNASILKDELNDTLNDFRDSEKAEQVQEKVIKCIESSLSDIMSKKRTEVKKKVLENNLTEIKPMNPGDQDEVGEFISELQKKRTVIQPSDLNAAVEAFINIKKSKSSEKFFKQLAELDPDDIEGWSKIMETWSLKQARLVLDLVRDRLKLIKELESKVNDPKTLELKELQPLFNRGLWIFGPKYEDIEFTSNKSLYTIAVDLLKKFDFKLENPNLRPDFMVSPKSTLSLHSCDKESADEDGEPEGIDELLLIELKRGGSNIKIGDRSQAEEYIEELINGGVIDSTTKIRAYILGSKVSCGAVSSEDKRVRYIPMQYHVILNNAEKRMLNLRRKLRDLEVKDEPMDETINEVIKQQMLI